MQWMHYVIIFVILIIIFLVCKKTNYKNESIFFKNKIDILVFIFIISTFLPLKSAICILLFQM